MCRKVKLCWESYLKHNFSALFSFCVLSGHRNCSEVHCFVSFHSAFVFFPFFSLLFSFSLSLLPPTSFFVQQKVKKNNVILVSKVVCFVKKWWMNAKALFKLSSSFLTHKYVQFSSKLCTIFLLEEILLDITGKSFTKCNL